jgi:putative ABC transport system ATP-binding protein
MGSFLSLLDVHKNYQLGETVVPALRGANLELNQGEFTALIGASGSGKSTLLNLIGCIDEPDRGKVLLQGIDVASLTDVERSRLRNQKIGFIFQSFNLVPVLNVYENVELPLLIHKEIPRSEHHARVLAAIEDVGLTSFLHQIPDKLSGGQRQRVAIARALVTNPLLVLADEPTANLDSETANKILDLMLELNRKRRVTFLFSTHDEKVMTRVQRVVRIQDGVIVS